MPFKKIRCEVYCRVVGYFRPVNQYNKGKAEEFWNRTDFDKKRKKPFLPKNKKNKKNV